MIGRRFTSERIRRERRSQFATQAGLGAGVIVALVLLLWQISFIPEISITRVSFEGNTNVSSEELFVPMHDMLSGAYAHLFSKRNVFLVRTRAMEDALEAQFPRLERVRIDRVGFTKLHVAVEERAPYGFWCSDAPKCYFIDRTSFVFADAPQFLRSNSFVRYLGGEVNAETPIGSSFLPRDAFSALETFLKELRRSNVRVLTVDYGDDRIAVEAKPTTGSGAAPFSIFVTASSSYAQPLLDFETIIASPDFQTEVPSLSNLDYIDLRFGNKVFYKLKTGATAEIEEE